MNRLAIFDIDGTLTDTNGVDDECYRAAVGEAIGVAEGDIDWSGAAHVTDSEIFQWLCRVHGRGVPSASFIAEARSRFVERRGVLRLPLRARCLRRRWPLGRADGESAWAAVRWNRCRGAGSDLARRRSGDRIA